MTKIQRTSHPCSFPAEKSLTSALLADATVPSICKPVAEVPVRNLQHNACQREMLFDRCASTRYFSKLFSILYCSLPTQGEMH